MNDYTIEIGDILLHENGHMYKVIDTMIGVIEGGWDGNMVHKTVEQGGRLYICTDPYPIEKRNSYNYRAWREVSDFITVIDSVRQ